MLHEVRRILARLRKIKMYQESVCGEFLRITRVFRQLRLEVSVQRGPEQAACNARPLVDALFLVLSGLIPHTTALCTTQILLPKEGAI